MASKDDIHAWKVPRCLVDNVKDGGDSAMQVNQETLAAIRLIDAPLVVVSIVGLYRTGKSYLMNRLAGAKTGEDYMLLALSVMLQCSLWRSGLE